MQIMYNPEQRLHGRLAHRGYSLEDCRDFLSKKSGNVIIVSKRSKRHTDLRDFIGIKSC
ncbi:MAG: hypothetical protein GX334_00595 [Firmicutes bacterium]|nr:hypothetical protein [Bacillota bacterium]